MWHTLIVSWLRNLRLTQRVRLFKLSAGGYLHSITLRDQKKTTKTITIGECAHQTACTVVLSIPVLKDRAFRTFGNVDRLAQPHRSPEMVVYNARASWIKPLSSAMQC